MAMGLHLKQRWRYIYIYPFCPGISGHIYLLLTFIIVTCWMGKLHEMWLSNVTLNGNLIYLRFQFNIEFPVIQPSQPECAEWPCPSQCPYVTSLAPMCYSSAICGVVSLSSWGHGSLSLQTPLFAAFSQRPIMNDGQGHLKEWGRGVACKIQGHSIKLTNVSFLPCSAGQGHSQVS